MGKPNRVAYGNPQEASVSLMGSKADYAYAAGIIDGEGCIQILHSVKPDGAQSWKIAIEINMCSKKVLDKMVGLFGGSLKEYGVRPNMHYKQFRWQVYSKTVYNALKKMRPYLIEKLAQADLAIQFFNHQRRCKYCYGHPLSASILAKRERMKQRMSELKRVDLIPIALAETECRDAAIGEATVQPN